MTSDNKVSPKDISEITVRDATPLDADFIIQSQLKSAKETEPFNLDFNTVKAGLNALFEDPSKGKYYIAELNGRVVACLLVNTEWSEWRNGFIFWINSVYVEKEARRSGVYRKMYRYLQDLVTSRSDIKGIRLYVEKQNHVAQAAYRELGMSDDHYSMFEWMPSS